MEVAVDRVKSGKIIMISIKVYWKNRTLIKGTIYEKIVVRKVNEMLPD